MNEMQSPPNVKPPNDASLILLPPYPSCGSHAYHFPILRVPRINNPEMEELSLSRSMVAFEWDSGPA